MNPETSAFLALGIFLCVIPAVLLLACGLAACMLSSKISQERGE